VGVAFSHDQVYLADRVNLPPPGSHNKNRLSYHLYTFLGSKEVSSMIKMAALAARRGARLRNLVPDVEFLPSTFDLPQGLITGVGQIYSLVF
jgi:hypothetical protein